MVGDPEASGCHLLDGAAAQVAVCVRLIAHGILAAFAGVRLATDAIHGDGQRLMRLLRDRTVGHSARREPFDDLFGRLDFLERDGGAD
jgi:hypothetical protein